jgi:hypothetical protein
VLTNVGGDDHVITYASDKRFGLAGTDHMSLEGNITVGREGKASVFIPTIDGTSFRDLGIVRQRMYAREISNSIRVSDTNTQTKISLASLKSMRYIFS